MDIVNPQIDSQQAIMPVRRDLRFQLPAERIADWHPAGREASLIFGALSLTFPEGERMFIRSVRELRDRIRSPELDRQVAGFIGQEAMHGREHQSYNDLLRDAGYPVAEIDERILHNIGQVETNLPPAGRLAVTMALEHWTAILANVMLREPEVLAGAEPHYLRLWRWHALEETEHKAVAFDVYREVIGSSAKAYWLRVSVLFSVTCQFWVHIYQFYSRLQQADDAKRGRRSSFWRRLSSFLKFGFVTPGILRKVIPAWLSYYRPGFHPWDENNRRFLDELPQLEQELRAGYAAQS